jgi:hypothetical protein
MGNEDVAEVTQTYLVTLDGLQFIYVLRVWTLRDIFLETDVAVRISESNRGTPDLERTTFLLPSNEFITYKVS